MLFQFIHFFSENKNKHWDSSVGVTAGTKHQFDHTKPCLNLIWLFLEPVKRVIFLHAQHWQILMQVTVHSTVAVSSVLSRRAKYFRYDMRLQCMYSRVQVLSTRFNTLIYFNTLNVKNKARNNILLHKFYPFPIVRLIWNLARTDDSAILKWLQQKGRVHLKIFFTATYWFLHYRGALNPPTSAITGLLHFKNQMHHRGPHVNN